MYARLESMSVSRSLFSMDEHNLSYFEGPLYPKRARGSAVGRGTALQVGRSRVPFPMVSLEFFIDIILPAALSL